MNVVNEKSVTSRGGFGLGAVIVISIFSLLAGAVLESRFRPNNILLYVNPDSKVSLLPQTGDVIQWATAGDPQGTTVKIGFTGGPGMAPCVNAGTPGSTCTYQPINGGPTLYLYGCTLSQSPSICYDPGIGNTSPSIPPPGSGPSLFGQLGQVVARIVMNVTEMILPRPAPPIPPQKLTAPSEGTVATPAQGGGGGSGSTPPLPGQLIEVVAECNSGAPAVFSSGASSPMTTPIAAAPGDTITWNPYGGYYVSDLSICAQTSISSNGNQSCTINTGTAAGLYTYKLAMPCTSAHSTTESIQVEIPNAGSAAGTK